MDRPRLLSLLVICGACGATAAQPCEPYWISLNSPIYIPQGHHTLVVFDDSSGLKLYAAGIIPLGGGYSLHAVARWDGRAWEVIEQGMPPRHQLSGLMSLDYGSGPSLYVWMRTPGVPWDWLFLRWTGEAWELAPSFLWDDVEPRFTFDDGSGPTVYGMRSPHPWIWHIVRWNGGDWEIIGTTTDNIRRFIAFNDGSGPKLHIAAPINHISGVPIGGVARWTGSAWESVGPAGQGQPVPRDMVVHDDVAGARLYVTSYAPGGDPTDLIARWDGQNWSSLPGGGIMLSGITTLHALASFDDGTGPALFVGGYMNLAGGGVPVRGIARWKNGVWDNMHGGSIGGIVSSFAVYDDGRGPSLFVGGEFGTVGSGALNSAKGVAQWVGCADQCYADCDNSSIGPRLNVDDFTCFIDRFSRGDPYADCDLNGTRNIQDFLCFIDRFSEGCR
jgi:trimeric autotransporter adhesin